MGGKFLFHQYVANPKLTQKLLTTLPFSAMPLFVKGKYFAPKLKKRHLKALKAAGEQLGYDVSIIQKDLVPKFQILDTFKNIPNETTPKILKHHPFIRGEAKIEKKIEQRRVKIDKIVAALKTSPVSIYGHKKRLRRMRRKSKMSPMLFGRIERRIDKLYMNRRLQHNGGRWFKGRSQRV